MKSPRIGLFGGTFDPPHLGHLILAAESQAQLHLDRVLWLLTAHPPHKAGQPITPLQHRLAMLQRMLSDNPTFALSDVEIRRPGPHYAADTLALLRPEYPTAQLIYLIGSDSLGDLPRWHRPHDVLSGCDALGVMRRPGTRFDLDALESALPGLRAKVRFVEAPLLEIASSAIRQRIRSGGHFRYYLPAAVYQYIQSHNLYR
jgi:nicotinate-nucleotide adenylyltransferase